MKWKMNQKILDWNMNQNNLILNNQGKHINMFHKMLKHYNRNQMKKSNKKI